MNGYAELRMLASQVPSGVTVKAVCPFCGGGRTSELSLSLTGIDGSAALYICHRAQCGREGRVGETLGIHRQPENRPREFTARIYSGTLEELPDVIFEYYIAKYGFTDTDLKRACRWDSRSQRTVWEVRSPTGAIRGYELRSHRDEDRPKTIHYRHSPDPWQGFHGGSYRGDIHGVIQTPIVLVEDCVSAAKVSAVFNSVSLMGTSLNLDRVTELIKTTQGPLVLALDRDAWDKAVKLCERYMFIAPNLVPMKLERDLKYETHMTIREMVESVL